MRFEDQLREEWMPTARHEFGHFVAAKELGFETGAVSIAPAFQSAGPGGKAAIRLANALHTLDEVADYCERRVKVLISGVLAEALENGTINNARARGYATNSRGTDFPKAREIVHLLRSIRHPHTTDEDDVQKQLSDIIDGLWNDAAKIIVKHSVFIQQMAAELVEKEVEAHEEPTFTEEELAHHPAVEAAFPNAIS